jgi:hypothetical protein
MAQEFAFKDYYLILGLEPGVGEDDIRTAFRKLARETHPDITKNSGNYEAFILIREGYDILSDRSKRAEYDAMRKAFQSRTNDPAGADVESVARDFDISGNNAYRDEWEYFKLHPDDYLGLFESSLRMFCATMLAVLAGAAAPLAVFAGTICIILIYLLLIGTIIGAFITTSLSSIVGIIMAVLIYRRLREIIARVEERGVSFFGRMVVYPLRGIPKKYGRGILYMNYAAVFVLLAVFGYFVVSWVFGRLPVDSLPGEKQMLGVASLVLLAVFTVVIIATSLVLIFEIVMDALARYPAIRYTRIRVKKRKGILYQAPRRIGNDGNAGER